MKRLPLFTWARQNGIVILLCIFESIIPVFLLLFLLNTQSFGTPSSRHQLNFAQHIYLHVW